MKLGAWSYIFQIIDYNNLVSKVRNTWLVAFQMGKTAEAAIDSVSETSDAMTNAAVTLVIDKYPGGEMAVE